MSGDHNMFASGSGDGQRSGWRKRTIMDMAREAGICTWLKPPTDVVERIEAFAALVREEATAEANARANASWTLMCEKMVAIEREACAKVAMAWAFNSPKQIAAAIRARGQA